MKLRILYTPEDSPAQSWEIDPDQLLSVEAEMLERQGGDVWGSYLEFWGRVETGNIRAWRALLWLLLQRTNPKLRFADVVFRINEFGVEIDDDEESPKDQPELPADTDTGSPSAMPDLPPDSENSTDGQSVSSTQPVTG